MDRNNRFHGKLVPPVILLLNCLFIFAVWRFTETISLPAWPGYSLLAIGVLIAFIAARQFAKVKTGLVPGTKATTVVSNGIFAFSRNPMYLGMAVFLIGLSWLSGSLLSLLAPLYFIAHIEKNFIESEEAFMEESLGDAYLAYKKSVRRWL